MERPISVEDYLSGKTIIPRQREQIMQYAGYLSAKVRHSDHASMKWGVLKHIENIVSDVLGDYSSVLQNQKVIEICPGRNPLASFLLEHAHIRHYVGVEPLRPELTEEKIGSGDSRITLERSDGLAYLLQQPNESAVVMSFGVFDWTIYGFTNRSVVWSRTEIDDYMRLLIKEIYRVTPSGALTVHHPVDDGKVASFFDMVGFHRHKTFDSMFFFQVNVFLFDF